jgi:PhnB protein
MSDARWTFSPYLHLENAREAIDWYARALGAEVRECHEMGDGKIGHAELDLHGNVLCLADCATGTPLPKRYSDVAIGLYAVVPDVDAVFNAAVAAGATVERPLADQPYGHRNGGFIDPFGNVWYVSMPIPAQSNGAATS